MIEVEEIAEEQALLSSAVWANVRNRYGKSFSVDHWGHLGIQVQVILRDLIRGRALAAGLCHTNCMSIKNIERIMMSARFENIEDNRTVFGSIPGFRGVWATGKTRNACAKILREVLEEWLQIKARRVL